MIIIEFTGDIMIVEVIFIYNLKVKKKKEKKGCCFK